MLYVEVSCSHQSSPFIFQISGRLFSDSGLRRSTRLASDASVNVNASTTGVSGNGNNNSSKYLGSSKFSSMAFRNMTVRKGTSWANENIDEGGESLSMKTVLCVFMEMSPFAKYYCFGSIVI